jgi:RNA polymerase sigma-70 factor (ECF subfamily)
MTIFAKDADLLRRFRAGDAEALRKVYWAYVARVESVVRRTFAHASRGGPVAAGVDLPDVVQEVFVRAFSESARRAYDGAREYAPFLMTIARNAAVDHLRRSGHEFQVSPERLARLVEENFAAEGDDPPWTDPETIVAVEHYVAGLPPRESSVYEQRYRLGRSQEDAAAVLGMTRQQVRTLEEHLRDGLARQLARVRLAAPPVAAALTIASGARSLGVREVPRKQGEE